MKPFSNVQVNIERSDGLLVDWLIARGYEVHITPPAVLAHRRPRRAKDDRGDAYLLAYLLYIKDPDARLTAIVTQIEPIKTAFLSQNLNRIGQLTWSLLYGLSERHCTTP